MPPRGGLGGLAGKATRPRLTTTPRARRAIPDDRYAPPVESPQDARPPLDPADEYVRDPLANPEAVLAARQRPMSERLELALSWNSLASELRAGLAEVLGRTKSSR